MCPPSLPAPGVEAETHQGLLPDQLSSHHTTKWREDVVLRLREKFSAGLPKPHPACLSSLQHIFQAHSALGNFWGQAALLIARLATESWIPCSAINISPTRLIMIPHSKAGCDAGGPSRDKGTFQTEKTCNLIVSSAISLDLLMVNVPELKHRIRSPLESMTLSTGCSPRASKRVPEATHTDAVRLAASVVLGGEPATTVITKSVRAGAEIYSPRARKKPEGTAKAEFRNK